MLSFFRYNEKIKTDLEMSVNIMGKLPLLKISVRNLVEFILRSGDIDNRVATSVKMDAMQAGSRMHRKIQRRMGNSFH